MAEIGIRELKQNASAAVARAAAGEEITVNVRGTPVARLVPLGTSRLEELIASGQARPARGNGRGGWPPVPSQPLAGTRAVNQSGVGPLEARALLIGLARQPAVIAAHAEHLSHLHFADPALDRVRMALVEATWRGETLEGDGISTILRRVGAIELLSKQGRANGLAFSFQRGDADPERARRDLGEVIDVMVRRSELDARIAEATARLGNATDDGAWEEQLHLIRERQETERRLSELRELAGDAEL